MKSGICRHSSKNTPINYESFNNSNGLFLLWSCCITIQLKKIQSLRNIQSRKCEKAQKWANKERGLPGNVWKVLLTHLWMKGKSTKNYKLWKRKGQSNKATAPKRTKSTALLLTATVSSPSRQLYNGLLWRWQFAGPANTLARAKFWFSAFAATVSFVVLFFTFLSSVATII